MGEQLRGGELVVKVLGRIRSEGSIRGTGRTDFICHRSSFRHADPLYSYKT